MRGIDWTEGELCTDRRSALGSGLDGFLIRRSPCGKLALLDGLRAISHLCEPSYGGCVDAAVRPHEQHLRLTIDIHEDVENLNLLFVDAVRMILSFYCVNSG